MKIGDRVKVKDQDIYGVNIMWDRYDTWSKIGFLKASIAFWLQREDLKDELIDFLKSLKI